MPDGDIQESKSLIDFIKDNVADIIEPDEWIESIIDDID